MRTLVALAVAAVATTLLWRLGASLLWAGALAVPLAALTVLAVSMPRPTDIVWQPPPQLPSTVADVRASTLTSRLAQAAEDPHRFAERIQPRLRKLHIEATELPSPDQLAEMLRRAE